MEQGLQQVRLGVTVNGLTYMFNPNDNGKMYRAMVDRCNRPHTTVILQMLTEYQVL